MSESPEKTSWAELVGTKGETAKETIERENPNVKAVVLKDGSPATYDFRTDRVRVWVDQNGLVLHAPTIGYNLS